MRLRFTKAIQLVISIPLRLTNFLPSRLDVLGHNRKSVRLGKGYLIRSLCTNKMSLELEVGFVCTGVGEVLESAGQ
jgi:hypothetical protein